MRLPPFEVLLSWPTPNYTNPETRGYALLVVNLIFIFFALFMALSRFYTRIFIRKWFGLDDVFLLAALIFTLGLTTVVLLANQDYGWDRHVYDIPLDKLQPASQIAMAAKLLFTAAATFTRLALFGFYYRLVKDSNKVGFLWLVHFNVAYSIAIFITFVFVIVFLCVPVQNYWIIGADQSRCLDEGTATMIAGIINVSADFIATVTPIPLVMSLQMPKKRRLAVVFLFSLGFLVTIAGCIRTWFIYLSLVLKYDTTWYAYPLWIAAAIEIDLGIICASAPVLRPLLSKLSINFSTKNTTPKTNTSKGYIRSVSTEPSGYNHSHHHNDSQNTNKISKNDITGPFELRDWQDADTERQNAAPMLEPTLPEQAYRHYSDEAVLHAERLRMEARSGGRPTHLQTARSWSRDLPPHSPSQFEWFDPDSPRAPYTLQANRP